MKQQPMVITNLRIPASDYRQIKSLAGELGMSVNEYINFIAKDATRKRMMKHDVATSKPRRAKETILEAFDRIAKMPGKPMGWSREDEAIYSV